MTKMMICLKFKTLFVVILLQIILFPAAAQTDRKAAELKNLEKNLAVAKGRLQS